MIIRVLKAFVFTSPAAPGLLTAAREEAFHPRGGPNHDGEYELADDHPIFSHSWFTGSHCDGRVESPEQRDERVAAAKLKATQLEDQRVQELAKATLATGMAERAATQGKLDTTEYEEAINTPLNELRARQGAGITTPVPKLRENQTRSAKSGKTESESTDKAATA